MRLAPRSVLSIPVFLTFAAVAAAQTTPSPQYTASSASPSEAPARVTGAVDEHQLVTLRGNVHPLARPEFDRGLVADGQVLHRILLILQRSPAQEAALTRFLDDQQNKSSENYQQWLSPEEFGRRFGPSTADLQGVTSWLTSQGFSGVHVSAGRTTIELSGNVAQLRNALHTEMHAYSVNDETHFANSSDPQIPAALSPLIAGVVALNDFPVKSHSHKLGLFEKSLSSGQTRPLFTFPGCSGNCFGLGPADFATIYNTAPLLAGSPKIDGTGQGIAVVGDSNINPQDVIDFRTMFGLPQNFSAANIILNGPDPGINGDEVEAALDVQWSGAVAPAARIDFVTSQSTETTSGVHLSALYIVDHNLDAVLTESFGACEQALGSANAFYNALWQQAAAQGITVILSSGDGGSAGCDNFNTQPTANNGLAVSGFASTPFNVAVGGTDFDQLGRESQFWNTNPTNITSFPVASSAKSYIPEIPWNDSCARNGLNGCSGGSFIDIIAGSGGVSTIYAKPSWQVGKGVPADGHRDLPDLSLFASNGFNDSFYIICVADQSSSSSCNLTNGGFTFIAIGGTSASAPAFAGIMALVNHKQATAGTPAPRQGNANYFLYGLAQQQNNANLACNSSASPASACNFQDVTKGDNSVPCSAGSRNCSSAAAGATGILVTTSGTVSTPAYTSTTGYDLATGLGSVNGQNLVNKWASVNKTASSTSLTLNNGAAVHVTHGQTVPFKISVTPSSATGDASLFAAPDVGDNTGLGPFTLVSGSASGSAALPGGSSYNVTAHYEGNGTDAPSDSAPVAVTVDPESSKVLITVPTFDPSTGQKTSSSPATLVYGSPYILRADVTGAQGTLCAPPACPRGNITFTDTVNGVPQGAPNSGVFALNSAGYAEDQPVQFPGGVNTITAAYSGDSSFTAPAQPTIYTLTVTPSPTQTSQLYVPSSALIGTPVNISASLITSLLFGGAPGGTIRFFDAGVRIPGAATVTSTAGDASTPALLNATLSAAFTTPGTHSITAEYSGDGSYAASKSAAATLAVRWPTTLSLPQAFQTVNFGDSVTVTATLTTPGKTPPITGQFQFQLSGVPNLVTPTLTVDSSGNQTLTATATLKPQDSGQIQVQYTGDTNYSVATSGEYINLIVPDFSVTAALSTLTVTSSQPATTTITITPASGTTSSVALSCFAQNAQGVTCSVTPASVDLVNGSPVNATLTVTATPGSEAAHASVTRKRSLLPVLFVNGRNPQNLLLLFSLALLFLSLRRRNYRLVSTLSAVSVLLAALGCGGGAASTGGGGGGVVTPESTTTVITLASPKIAQGNSVSATAKVTSTKSVTGTVNFFELNNDGALAPPVAVVNGSATTSLSVPSPGFHQIYAQYSGDAANTQSTSAQVPLVVTGSSNLGIIGKTGPLSRDTVDTINVN
jgi:hypothetical protein